MRRRGAITPDLRDALSANKAELSANPDRATDRKSAGSAQACARKLVQAPERRAPDLQTVQPRMRASRSPEPQAISPKDLRSLRRPDQLEVELSGCARKKKHAVLNSKRPVLRRSMLLIRTAHDGGRNRKRPRAGALSTRSCGLKRKHANVRLKRPAVASLRPNWLASKKN